VAHGPLQQGAVLGGLLFHAILADGPAQMNHAHVHAGDRIGEADHKVLAQFAVEVGVAGLKNQTTAPLPTGLPEKACRKSLPFKRALAK
jgi:hypothetical protein